MSEKEKVGLKFTSAKDYFAGKGLNPGVAKNSFSIRDAVAILEKAAADLKEARLTEKTIKDVVNQAWGLFKILA